MVMLGAGLLTLVGSILFVWLYVGRSILRRIRSLQRSMLQLSSGDLESEIYQSHQKDEIAAMADSLLVFRDSMIQSRALSADQDKDRIAKSERATRMETRIVEFETTVRSALDSLQSAAGSMQTTAQSMSTTADQSSALVNAVASAAEETSVNVQTVSSGTEPLSSSIEEIGRQAVTSAESARKAIEVAGIPSNRRQDRPNHGRPPWIPGGGGGPGCGAPGDRAKHPARRRRHQRGPKQHRGRSLSLDRSWNRRQRGADRLQRAPPR